MISAALGVLLDAPNLLAWASVWKPLRIGCLGEWVGGWASSLFLKLVMTRASDAQGTAAFKRAAKVSLALTE